MSAGVWGRSQGFFAIIWRKSLSSPGGTSGRNCWMGAGVRVRCQISFNEAEGASGKGGLPVRR